MTADPRAILEFVPIAGAWYLLPEVVAPLGLPYASTLIVSGDVAATARNILASETLFRLAIASELAAAFISIFLGHGYRLLKDANLGYARLMVVLVALVTRPI